MSADLMFEVLATPELEAPPVQPEAHRGEIIGVTLVTLQNEKGSTKIQIDLKSMDAPVEDRFDVWLPKLFVEDIHVDPNTLPDEEGNKQKTQYGMTIARSDKSATIQKLLALAAEAGRTAEGVTKPTNIEEYVTVLAHFLTGLEVVFTRDAQKNANPQFANKLRVNGIYSINSVNNPKALKRYARRWE